MVFFQTSWPWESFSAVEDRMGFAFCFPYNATSCFCVSGHSSETWPKASYSYKATIIHCHYYIYWMASLLFLRAPWGFSKAQLGTQIVFTSDFTVLGYLVMQNRWEALRTSFSLLRVCFPSTEFPVLLNFPNAPPRNWEHDQLKAKGMIYVFWYFWCLENSFHALEEASLCSRYWRDQNLSCIERISRWLEANTAKCKYTWVLHPSHFISVIMKDILFPSYSPCLFTVPFLAFCTA